MTIKVPRIPNTMLSSLTSSDGMVTESSIVSGERKVWVKVRSNVEDYFLPNFDQQSEDITEREGRLVI